MRRSEILLTAALAALASFVVAQVVTRRAYAVRSGPRQHAVAQSNRVASVDTRATVVAIPQTADRPSPAAGLGSDDTRARIASAGPTYMADMLADLHGSLVRWPDRRERGLRVWVQSSTTVRDWDLRYAQMARDAFADWNANLPMRFDFVLDSATSDVRVTWTDRFAPELGQRVGTTNRVNDQNGWIVAAEIIVAIHDSAGRIIRPSNLIGIVRHEAGHSLGLGHSKDPTSKMFPIEMASDISPADRATLTLLYRLPPGPVH